MTRRTRRQDPPEFAGDFPAADRDITQVLPAWDGTTWEDASGQPHVPDTEPIAALRTRRHVGPGSVAALMLAREPGESVPPWRPDGERFADPRTWRNHRALPAAPEPPARQRTMAPAAIARPGTLSSLTAAEVETHMLRIPPPFQMTAAESRQAVAAITYPPPGAGPERYAAVMCQAGAATGTSSTYEWPAAWGRRGIEAGTDTAGWDWDQIRETEEQMRARRQEQAGSENRAAALAGASRSRSRRAAERDAETARALLARDGWDGRQRDILTARAGHPEWTWAEVAGSLGLTKDQALATFRRMRAGAS